MILVNGKPVASENATVPALDAGFLYGETVFTTIGIVGGTPLFLDRHIERLTRMANVLGLKTCPGPALLQKGVAQMIGLHDPAPRLLRITVTPGTLSAASLDSNPDGPGSWFIFPVFRPDPNPTLYESGIDVEWGGPLSLPSRDPRATLKTGNLLTTRWLRSRKRSSSVDILLSGRSGRILEGTVSNVFFVIKDGTVQTPPESWGVLPGIVRSLVLTLLEKHGTPFSSGSPTRKELSGIREIFLTNSYLGIMPVARILPSFNSRNNEIPLWEGTPPFRFCRTLRDALGRIVQNEQREWLKTLSSLGSLRLQERGVPD